MKKCKKYYFESEEAIRFDLIEKAIENFNNNQNKYVKVI